MVCRDADAIVIEVRSNAARKSNDANFTGKLYVVRIAQNGLDMVYVVSGRTEIGRALLYSHELCDCKFYLIERHGIRAVGKLGSEYQLRFECEHCKCNAGISACARIEIGSNAIEQDVCPEYDPRRELTPQQFHIQ